MHLKQTVFFALTAALVQPSAARAASEVSGPAEIAAVTVFPDRAEVVRSVEVGLPAGQSTVVIEGLPASLISESVRVRGEAEGVLLIGSVETKRRFAERAVREEEHRLTAELESLEDRGRVLSDRIAAARTQLEFLAALGREAPRTANQQVFDGKLDPQAWRQTLDLLGEGVAKAYAEIRAAEIEKRGLERKIAQTQQRLNQVRTGHTAVVAARVNVETTGPTTARLRLSYQVPGASWRPLYEARLDTASGRVRLVQVGEVRQGTGEDWSNVDLTLSTARPAQGARLPQLDTWFIDFAALAGRYRDRLNARSELRELEDTMQKQARPDASPEEAPRSPPGGGAGGPAEPVTAQVVAGEFAAEYRIPGAADVPSDNEPHKFTITERSLDATLAVRTVPKLAPVAHLYGEVTFEGSDPWLPGPVAIFRDGAFVGSGAVSILRPGEAFKLSFGVDDKVRVAYRLEAGERSHGGLINKHRRIERRYRIEVANHHAEPMEITLLDQLPVPRDERIEVELLDLTTQPSERDFDGRSGVLAWTDTYAPNEERVIRFGYAVTYPENQAVPGF